MRRETHLIEANGLQHYVRDSGPQNGPVAILLHGFPDTGALWDGVTAQLTDAGYRIIAPDMRGFGETELAACKAAYEINAGSVPDIIALCEALNINRAHIVGHDFGAPVAWTLAAQHPDIFSTLTAISVGHVRAFLKAGLEQRLKSWYIIFHQLRYFSEAAYQFHDWMLLRNLWPRSRIQDVDITIRALSRPGRLTAGLNWYRANMSLNRIVRPPAVGSYGEEIVRIPTLGIWSSDDRYLGERQMTLSEDYVEAPWRYERLDGVGHWIPDECPNKLAEILIDHWQNARSRASPNTLPRTAKSP